MKMNFLFAVLTAAFLSVASFAAAQVTIGGSDLPKAGTILDLNSTTKGGLALSNVSLTDLEKIPANQLVGITDEQDVNIDLTGAIVYNINPNFCLGVYVWNGNKWLKVDKDYQVKAAKVATLDIPAISDTDKDFIPENQELTFEVGTPGDAQYYHWYADNTYVTTTTTQEYITSAFSSLGSHTMKVVLDNCLSLSEPNAVPFTIRVSPATIPVNTSEYIRIYGNNIFTHVEASEYHQGNLVAHYDGINNAGLGDENHNFAATTWKDLSGKGNDLTRNYQTADPFDVTGYSFKNASDYWKKTSPAGIPTGNNSFSIEMRYKIAGSVASGICTISWGRDAASQALCYGFRSANAFTLAHWSNDIDAPYTNARSTDNTLTATYTEGTGNNATAKKVYANAVSLAVTSNSNAPNIASGYPLYVGIGPNGNTTSNDVTNLHLQSLRIYSKALSQGEIDANFAVDKKRYIELPTVTVNGVACTNVAILSPRILTCKAPKISTTGEAVVIVTGDGVSTTLNLNHGELKYVP